MACNFEVAGFILSAPVFTFLGKFFFLVKELTLFTQV
jgi:hypothetical protein